MASQIEFRAAQPSDVHAAVPLIYSSGPEAFNFVFKPTPAQEAQNFLRRAFVRPGGEFGYRNHIVALVNHQVVGIGTAFSGDAVLEYTTSAARVIFGMYGLHSFRVAINGLRVENIVKQPQGNIHYIAHLGVVPELRSQGIGAAIVQELLQQGARRGRSIAELDVAVTNPRAQALYERLGFQIISEHASNLQNAFARVPAHRRMRKSIDTIRS